jgi:OmpA-OmpF porin, OOP family
MTVNSRIKVRGTNASMVFFLLLVALLYSFTTEAQSLKQRDLLHPIEKTKNADQKIHLAENVNPGGKAIPLNPSINSPYDDIKPALTPCGKRLYFSRHLHPNNTFGEADMEDIWYSDFDETSNTWSDPALMTGDLNNSGPNYINNVSVTGDTVILGNQYRPNGKMRAGLSYSVNVNGQWSFPKTINIKDHYNMARQSNSFVSLKNGIIIMAIQRGETYGERDLYVSFWDGTEATEPINMGGVINSAFEESSPFLSADNKTLYFASKGHNGFGGADIYVTKRLDESWTNWSTPENLGPAVNGPMDDEFFSITHCGNYAIFSKQVNVHNTDLYRISMEELFRQPVKPKQDQSEKRLSAFASL